jgi:hypothetical protein
LVVVWVVWRKGLCVIERVFFFMVVYAVLVFAVGDKEVECIIVEVKDAEGICCRGDDAAERPQWTGMQ